MKRYNRIVWMTLPSIVAVLILGVYVSFFNKGGHTFSKTGVPDFIKVPANPYQDIIINNKLVRRGSALDCPTRYAAIKKVLDKLNFERPITVLDIGADFGYFSFRIAHDYDATCVMISDPNLEKMSLKKLCEYNTDLHNLVLMSKRITGEELQLLSESEHFDVVLCLNVLHHFPKGDWKRAAEALMNLGDYLIVETPPKEDIGTYGSETFGEPFLQDIISFFESKSSLVIHRTPRQTNRSLLSWMYVVKGQNKRLHRRGFIDLSNTEYEIYSNKQEKFLVKCSDIENYKRYHTTKDLYRLPYPPGINLMTFKLLHGVYPTNDMIKKAIAELKTKGCNIAPHELVIQGETLVPMCEHENIIFDDTILQQVCNLVDTANVKKMALILKNIHHKVNAT